MDKLTVGHGRFDAYKDERRGATPPTSNEDFKALTIAGELTGDIMPQNDKGANDRLLSCPFCGDDDLLPMMISEAPLWEVHCGGDCPVRPTAYGKTEPEAIAKWNHRGIPYKDTDNG